MTVIQNDVLVKRQRRTHSRKLKKEAVTLVVEHGYSDAEAYAKLARHVALAQLQIGFEQPYQFVLHFLNNHRHHSTKKLALAG